jgi:ribosomal protein L12E/L44/L45/RPP1/RPP2
METDDLDDILFGEDAAQVVAAANAAANKEESTEADGQKGGEADDLDDESEDVRNSTSWHINYFIRSLKLCSMVM